MSIVDTVKDQLSGTVLKTLSVAVGESESKTSELIGSAVPAILASLANSVLSGESFDGLMDALRGFEGTDPVAILRSPNRDVPVAPPGGEVLGSLLGPNLSTLTEVLAKSSSVGLPAVERLLGYLGPIILGAVAARLVGGGGLTPANLTSFFTAQKPGITGSLPAGLSLADLPSIPGVPTSVPAPRIPESGLPAWLIPALVLGFLALAVFYSLKMPPEDPASRKPAEPTRAAPGPEAIPPAPSGDAPPISSKDQSR